MRLPLQTSSVDRAREVSPLLSGGLSPQGCDILCLLTKAPQCIAKCVGGDIPGCLLCAGSAAVECGCV